MNNLFEDNGAEISACGKYRFKLWRIWDKSKPLVLWIMHNPSKADASQNDPTITRIIGFTKAWGYGGLYVGNLFPYRSTKPDVLKKLPFSEIAPLENIKHTNDMVKKCQLHILAYGNPVVSKSSPMFLDAHWHYLKLTKSGNPYHPLYLKSDLLPIIY